jgi:hypothetical protein
MFKRPIVLVLTATLFLAANISFAAHREGVSQRSEHTLAQANHHEHITTKSQIKADDKNVVKNRRNKEFCLTCDEQPNKKA